MSNFAYSQIKISDYISFYFAALGVGTAVIASEINYFYNLNDSNKEQIMVMLTISNISTLFLILSIISRYQMYIQWKRTKLLMDRHDNLINTGLWKMMTFEVLISIIMSYPSQYGMYYTETDDNNYVSPPYQQFITNDLLLCIMIFCRIHHLVKILLMASQYTEPRS